LPWRDVPQTSLDRVYLEKGFFPALKKGEKETVKELNLFDVTSFAIVKVRPSHQ